MWSNVLRPRHAFQTLIWRFSIELQWQVLLNSLSHHQIFHNWITKVFISSSGIRDTGNSFYEWTELFTMTLHKNKRPRRTTLEASVKHGTTVLPDLDWTWQSSLTFPATRNSPLGVVCVCGQENDSEIEADRQRAESTNFANKTADFSRSWRRPQCASALGKNGEGLKSSERSVSFAILINTVCRLNLPQHDL